jgi:hypothetical protein
VDESASDDFHVLASLSGKYDQKSNTVEGRVEGLVSELGTPKIS